jgi:IS30 family transposase
MSHFSISGRVIGGQRAAIPSEPSTRQGDLSHTRRPRVIETLRQPRNHPPQQRKEGDLIIGLKRSAVATLIERPTRYAMLVHLPRQEGYGLIPPKKNAPALAGYGPMTMKDALAAVFAPLPDRLRRSLTWDRGKELSAHALFRQQIAVPVYFADAKSPWQRGSNEHLNGLLRQYLPKGTDLSRGSAEDIAAVARAINSRPRGVLGWRTPAEVFEEQLRSAQQHTVATTG